MFAGFLFVFKGMEGSNRFAFEKTAAVWTGKEMKDEGGLSNGRIGTEINENAQVHRLCPQNMHSTK